MNRKLLSMGIGLYLGLGAIVTAFGTEKLSHEPVGYSLTRTFVDREDCEVPENDGGHPNLYVPDARIRLKKTFFQSDEPGDERELFSVIKLSSLNSCYVSCAVPAAETDEKLFPSSVPTSKCYGSQGLQSMGKK